MPHSPLNLEDILTDRVVEEDLLEVPVADRLFRRLRAVGGAFALVVLLRVGYLAIHEHETLAARAVANMSDATIAEAPRGGIADRFGNPIVENVPSFNILLTPRYLPSTPEGRASEIDGIASALGTDRAELARVVAAKDWSVNDELVLATNPPPEAIVSIAARGYRGVSVVPTFERKLRNTLAFSHVVGYVGLVNDDDLRRDRSLTGNDTVGRAGLERSYDPLLRGVHGTTVTIRNARGEAVGTRLGRDPEPGADLTTTIDGPLQEYLYERLTQALRELGRTSGAGIALDPRNGEVRALVSVPGYGTDRIERYLTDPTKPLFNRAVGGVYNPGSTIKPIVATAALTDGIVTPSTTIFSSGMLELPNPYHPDEPSRFPDWRPQGWVDVRSALAKSSNVYFYEVGGGFQSQPGLGIVALKRWWQRFRLDERTGIDLPGEAVGFLPDPVWHEATLGTPWRIGDTYHAAIGQGDLLVTPIGLLTAIAAVANGGTWYQPRLVTGARGGASPPLDRGDPIVLQDIRGEIGAALAVVREGMRDGVREPYGTSYLLHDLPLRAAGKTGTAQVENNEKTNAFFVGYLPAEHPELALLILVENSREGSANTTPVARDVFLWYATHRLLTSAPGRGRPSTEPPN